MSDWKKDYEHKYSMSYSIELQGIEGLKYLFQRAEIIYDETGMLPDETIHFTEDFSIKKQIEYNKEDADRVLNGSMSEIEYLNAHIVFISISGEPYMSKGDEGFPEFPGEYKKGGHYERG